MADLSVYNKFGKSQDTIGYLQGIEKNQQNLQAGRTSQAVNELTMQLKKLDTLKELAGSVKDDAGLMRAKSFARSMGVGDDILGQLPDTYNEAKPLLDSFYANSDAAKNELNAQYKAAMLNLAYGKENRAEREFQMEQQPQYYTPNTPAPQPQEQGYDAEGQDLINQDLVSDDNQPTETPVYDRKTGAPVIKSGAELYQKASGEKYWKPIASFTIDPVTGEKVPTGKMSGTAEKEKYKLEESLSSIDVTRKLISKARSMLSPEQSVQPYSGMGSNIPAYIERTGLGIPGFDIIDSERVAKTTKYNNLIQQQALSSLKALFGGNPTEGERKVLLDLQALSSKTPLEQKEILDNVDFILASKQNSAQQRLRSIVGGQSVELPSQQTQDEIINAEDYFKN